MMPSVAPEAMRDARGLLHDVIYFHRSAPRREKMHTVLPAKSRATFVTGKFSGTRGRKHIPAAAYTAWTYGEFVALGIVYACGGATSTPADASHLDDDRLCDSCALADLGPAVYRYYDAEGAPLYIGCTTQPLARMVTHSRTSPWWPEVARMQREHFATHDEALAVEAAAILAEQPRFNQRGLTLVAS